LRTCEEDGAYGLETVGKYTEACRRLGFDQRRVKWVKPLEEMKTTFSNKPAQLTTSPTY
jgi:hypothetical protein